MTMSKSQPTVLVVDDDEDLREVLCDVLECEGYAVIAVADGQSAIARADTAAIDLAVVDRHHPGPSGPVLVAELRRRHPAVSVLVISGAGGESFAGAANLSKPFTMTEFMAAVNRARAARLSA